MIEYHGIQHFEPVDFFGGEAQLETQKEHDKRKTRYAEEHNYLLVDFFEEDDNLELVLYELFEGKE